MRDVSIQRDRISNREASLPKLTENDSQIVPKECKNADYRKCVQENSRTFEANGELGSKLRVDQRTSTKRRRSKGRRTQFGKQWHFVHTTAEGSNTIPTRQHLELGQDPRARTDRHSTQRATGSQAGISSSQTPSPRLKIFLSFERDQGFCDLSGVCTAPHSP